MEKINAALIGSGNIGTDLMYKALRSSWIKPVWMVGIDTASDGLAKAREQGLSTTAEGIDALLPHLKRDGIRIAFDATSAYVHAENAESSPRTASSSSTSPPRRSVLTAYPRSISPSTSASAR